MICSNCECKKECEVYTEYFLKIFKLLDGALGCNDGFGNFIKEQFNNYQCDCFEKNE